MLTDGQKLTLKLPADNSATQLQVIAQASANLEPFIIIIIDDVCYNQRGYNGTIMYVRL